MNRTHNYIEIKLNYHAMNYHRHDRISTFNVKSKHAIGIRHKLDTELTNLSLINKS